MSGGAAERIVIEYPGAQAPDRQRFVDASGLRIAVREWGDASAPPLLLAHGGFGFARTYDVFAPLLAAGGFRVVSWDQRGHGDSEHAALYTWDADVRDALAVLDSTTRGAELARDVRPPDYATRFVIERPGWLAAVVEEPGVAVTTLAEALSHYAGWIDTRRFHRVPGRA